MIYFCFSFLILPQLSVDVNQQLRWADENLSREQERQEVNRRAELCCFYSCSDSHMYMTNVDIVEVSKQKQKQIRYSTVSGNIFVKRVMTAFTSPAKTQDV